jgi:hypothetical protein
MRSEKPSEAIMAGSTSAANTSCMSVSGSEVVAGPGDGGVGDTARTVFGGHSVGDPGPVRFRFSVCCWLGGAGVASGTFSVCKAVVVVGFLISVRISFTGH